MGSVIAPHDHGAEPVPSSARTGAAADRSTNVFDASAADVTETPHGGGALDATPHLLSLITSVVQPASLAPGLVGLNRQLDAYAAAARTIAEFRSPVAAELARMQRIQHDINRYIAPVRRVLEQTRWWAQQVAAMRRLTVRLVSMPQVW
jgi:hypothetical protein